MPSLPGPSLRGALSDSRARVRLQTGLFVITAAAGGLLGIASQALVARELEVEGFAVYAFCTGLLQFVAILFEFGIFIPAARRAALTSPSEGRAVVGAALSAYVPVGLAFSMTILVISVGINRFVEIDAAPALMLASALAFVFPFMLVGQALAQGLGRLHVFSVASLAWQGLFVAVLGVFALLNRAYGSAEAVLLRELAMALGVMIVCVWLRPKLIRLRLEIRHLLRGARDYGFSIYVGRVLSTGSYNMDILLVGIFSSAEAVAFYSVAKLLAYGVGLPATGASAALFTRMATSKELRSGWTRLALAVGIGATLLLVLIAPALIDLAYGSGFMGAVPLVLPLALAEALRGVAALYNQFLSAHGDGRSIRTAGAAFTVTNLLANFILIPLYGASGAAWASLTAMSVNLASHIYGYRRTTGRSRNS